MHKIAVSKHGPYLVSGDLPLIKVSATGEPIEPKYEPSIGLIEDPVEDCSGPIWVRGGVQIVSADGFNYELRNRVTLCRCGGSGNKPFCDGSHHATKFKDGL